MLHKLLPLGLALMGALMLILNRLCARQILHNHALFGGQPEAAREKRLLALYRVIAVLAGSLFFVFGMLISCGIIELRK